MKGDKKPTNFIEYKQLSLYNFWHYTIPVLAAVKVACCCMPQGIH
jgi:hypothetical protein